MKRADATDIVLGGLIAFLVFVILGSLVLGFVYGG